MLQVPLKVKLKLLFTLLSTLTILSLLALMSLVLVVATFTVVVVLGKIPIPATTLALLVGAAAEAVQLLTLSERIPSRPQLVEPL